MVKKDYARTAAISKKYGVIKKAPKGAFTTVYAKRAVASLKKQGVDVRGLKYKPAVVKPTPGGK